jgi:uncharacterized phiE125 gp8 family phage protein
VRIITPPIDPVIPLEQLLVDVRAPDVDGLTLERMTVEATQWVEARTQTAMLTQTREVDFPWFPTRAFDLSLSRPVQSITSIVYRDSLLASQTIDPANYYLQGVMVRPVSAWPVGSEVTIRFVAGYTSADLVPAPLKAALRMKVQELYDGDDTSDAVNAMLTNQLYIVA